MLIRCAMSRRVMHTLPHRWRYAYTATTPAAINLPPYRPPSEAHSLLLRATIGCPWNKCKFCTMYKDTQAAKRPVDAVLGDINTMAATKHLQQPYKSAFIGDSDALSHPQLAVILEHLCHNKFPEIETVTCYARAATVAALWKNRRKRLEEVRKAGLTRIHVGLESGDPEVLHRMDKGATPAIFEKCAEATRSLGLELSFYVLVGGGGESHWEKHAKGTARVIQACDPDYVRLRTLVVQNNSRLRQPTPDCVADTFETATPLTLLKETRNLLHHLADGPALRGTLASDHFTNRIFAIRNDPAQANQQMAQVFYDGVDGDLGCDLPQLKAELDGLVTAAEKEALVLLGANEMYRQGWYGGL